MGIITDITEFSQFLDQMNDKYNQNLISFNDCYEQVILRKDELVSRIKDFEQDIEIQKNQELVNQVKNRFNELILPYFFMGPNVKHVYDKPLGFVGDYETISFICAPFNSGLKENFGGVFDMLFYQCKACSQHRNKMEWLAQEYKSAPRDARILDFACGPAYDLQIFCKLKPNYKGEVVCLDVSEDALANLKTRIAEFSCISQFQFHQENVFTFLKRSFADNKQKYGSFDVISTCGIFDYLPDKYAVLFLKSLWSLLRPNGKLLFANLHPENPDRILMEWFGDWKVIYRTESDMTRLAKQADLPLENIQFQRDDSGICILATLHTHENQNLIGIQNKTTI